MTPANLHGAPPLGEAAFHLTPPTGHDADDAQPLHRCPTVMVVDDEQINLDIAREHLESSGCSQIVTSSDPTQVLALLRKHRPDVVLLDVVMPVMDGLEVLHQIRAADEFKCLPVIMCTAHHDPATKSNALVSGATDFLPKPVDFSELILRVRNALMVKKHLDHAEMRASVLEVEAHQQAEELARTRELAELRYLAGKAEIATDVLHNIGNALNSVNVALNLVGYAVRDSRLPSLKRIAELVQEHEADLGRYLTRDQRGKLLPSYLVELTDVLMQERKETLCELEGLTKHLDHIKAVLAAQQRYAKACNVVEETSLSALIEDAESLAEVINGGEVELVHDWHDVPQVRTDRQKLLQVLVNLIRNAAQSVKMAHASGGGRVEVRIDRPRRDAARIAVIDNGTGIAPENIDKLFTHGFTTRPSGHGFGLHSCANIVKELGGTIQAHSGGLGQGARFVIELPMDTETETP